MEQAEVMEDEHDASMEEVEEEVEVPVQAKQDQHSSSGPSESSDEDDEDRRPLSRRTAMPQELQDALANRATADPELLQQAMEWVDDDIVTTVLEEESDGEEAIFDPSTTFAVPPAYYKDTHHEYFCTPWGMKTIEQMMEIPDLRDILGKIIQPDKLKHRYADVSYWRDHKHWISKGKNTPEEAPLCIIARRLFEASEDATGCNLVCTSSIVYGTTGKLPTRGQVNFSCGDARCPSRQPTGKELAHYDRLKLECWFQKKCRDVTVRIREQALAKEIFRGFVARNPLTLQQLYCYEKARKSWVSSKSNELNDKANSEARLKLGSEQSKEAKAAKGAKGSKGGKGAKGKSPGRGPNGRDRGASSEPSQSRSVAPQTPIAVAFASASKARSKSKSSGPKKTPASGSRPADLGADMDSAAPTGTQSRVETLKRQLAEAQAQEEFGSGRVDSASKKRKKKKNKKHSRVDKAREELAYDHADEDQWEEGY